MRDVLLEVMEGRGVGNVSLMVERLCALLDSRLETLGADQLVNGSAALRNRTEKDFKRVIAEFADAQTQPSAPVPAPVGRGARGTCTQEEEALESGRTARGTCESGSR